MELVEGLYVLARRPVLDVHAGPLCLPHVALVHLAEPSIDAGRVTAERQPMHDGSDVRVEPSAVWQAGAQLEDRDSAGRQLVDEAIGEPPGRILPNERRASVREG